jgi:hypothetical protein
VSEENLVVFNGINGATGSYLVDPTPANELGKAALGAHWKEDEFEELSDRHARVTENRYALKAGLNPQDLSQAGWGVIFPANWTEEVQMAVREALWELLEHRKQQAGALYREFLREDAVLPEESKNAFLVRNKVGPGPVDPERVPFYLLLVGDPASISFQFQFELDVAYSVGRIYFDTLEEYANYARSVVTAERGMLSGKLGLPRKAAFWGPANPNDKATQLSAQNLVVPLHTALKKSFPSWELDYIPPEQSHKNRLLELLGGKQTPTLLFTASHGLGYPAGDMRQKSYQGALLCQDWPGPQPNVQGVERDAFVAAEDIASDASLLGMVCFHFACFGGGTPHWEHFAVPGVKQASALALRPFLSALPQRLLSHPRGGALAVVGHVDRAWSFSFQWETSEPQITTYESLMYRILSGETVGSALDDLNLRYAELATLLSTKIYEAEISRPDLMEMARLWIAHNDARGYALLGDPAVRLPLVKEDSQPTSHSTIQPVSGPAGTLPEAPYGDTPGTESIPQKSASSFTAPTAVKSKAQDWETLRKQIDQLLNSLSLLSLSTYLLPGGELAHLTDPQGTVPTGARLVAKTTLRNGQIDTVYGETDLTSELWEAHSRLLTEALADWNALLLAAKEVAQALGAPPD